MSQGAAAGAGAGMVMICGGVWSSLGKSPESAGGTWLAALGGVVLVEAELDEVGRTAGCAVPCPDTGAGD